MTQSEPTSGDYEYDEAHEAGADPSPNDSRSPSPTDGYEPVEVATRTDDDGGDLSYDLAHDIPPPGGD